MNRQAGFGWLLMLACALIPATGTPFQTAGEAVVKHGEIADDLYVAGGRIDVLADVEGDVLAAGGRVSIDSRVSGDVIAAGGSVTVHGRVDDDIRIGGGDVVINADIGDDAVAAGGNVLLAPAAKVGGDILLSGGQVELAGQVQGDARLAGGRISITGAIGGNVELAGHTIEIGPGAHIRGTLTYRSPEPATIDPQARIDGAITHIPTPLPGRQEVARGLATVGIVFWLSLAVTGVVLFLLLPREALAVVRILANEPWKVLGLGLAVVAATPLAGVMLLSTGIGWLLAWLLMCVYAPLLLCGFLVGTLSLGTSVLRRIRHGDEPSKLGISLGFVLALLVVMIVGLVPLLGWLLVVLVMLAGVGGIVLGLYRVRAVRSQ